MSDKFGFKHAFMAMAAVQALTLGLYDKLTASKLTFALGTMSVYFTLGGALVGGMRCVRARVGAGDAPDGVQCAPPFAPTQSTNLCTHISISLPTYLPTYLSHSPTPRGLRHVPALHLQALWRHQRRGHLLLHLHGLRARQHPRVRTAPWLAQVHGFSPLEMNEHIYVYTCIERLTYTCTSYPINNRLRHTHTSHSSIIAKKLVAYFGGYENVFKVRFTSNKVTVPLPT